MTAETDHDALAGVLHASGTCDAMFAHYGPAKKCERVALELLESPEFANILARESVETEPSVGGVRIMSAGTACDNDRCSVLVYNAEGPRVAGSPSRGCPSCGHDGFAVRFGIGLDAVTPHADEDHA